MTQIKFVPILREGDWESTLPRWLRGRLGFDLRAPKYDEAQYQELLSHLYGAVTAPPPIGPRRRPSAGRSSLEPFTPLSAKDGPARFRATGEPLGINWDAGFPGVHRDLDVFLSEGAAIWLRLMPTFKPPKTWPPHELRETMMRTANIPLRPLYQASTMSSLRAEDGFGMYSPSGTPERQTDSVAFWFETGEVWAIDTTYLHYSGDAIPVLEAEVADCLEGYLTLMKSLQIDGPFGWVCGVTGVKGRRLEIPTPPNRVRLGPGPQCLSNDIVADGVFEPGEETRIQLQLFFEKLFAKCGQPRPK